VLLYVGDPMCSWCYAFGPQLDAVLDKLAPIGCEVLAGGLRPYTRDPMDASMRELLRHHWSDVKQRSGRPLRFDLLERTDFIYDTEPASRAVATARAFDPQFALRVFSALQSAFYRDSRDVTQAATLADIAAECGLQRDAFLARWSSPEMRTLTQADFQSARRLGVTSFPTLLLRRGSQLDLVSRGYVEAAPLLAHVERMLEDR
jgi:putative protein-disulfide isomerase